MDYKGYLIEKNGNRVEVKKDGKILEYFHSESNAKEWVDAGGEKNVRNATMLASDRAAAGQEAFGSKCNAAGSALDVAVELVENEIITSTDGLEEKVRTYITDHKYTADPVEVTKIISRQLAADMRNFHQGSSGTDERESKNAGDVEAEVKELEEEIKWAEGQLAKGDHTPEQEKSINDDIKRLKGRFEGLKNRKNSYPRPLALQPDRAAVGAREYGIKKNSDSLTPDQEKEVAELKTKLDFDEYEVAKKDGKWILAYKARSKPDIWQFKELKNATESPKLKSLMEERKKLIAERGDVMDLEVLDREIEEEKARIGMLNDMPRPLVLPHERAQAGKEAFGSKVNAHRQDDVPVGTYTHKGHDIKKESSTRFIVDRHLVFDSIEKAEQAIEEYIEANGE